MVSHHTAAESHSKDMSRNRDSLGSHRTPCSSLERSGIQRAFSGTLNIVYPLPLIWWNRFVFSRNASVDARPPKYQRYLSSCATDCSNTHISTLSKNANTLCYPLNVCGMLCSRSQAPISGTLWMSGFPHFEQLKAYQNLCDFRTSVHDLRSLACGRQTSCQTRQTETSGFVTSENQGEEGRLLYRPQNYVALSVTPTGLCSPKILSSVSEYIVDEQLIEILMKRAHATVTQLNGRLTRNMSCSKNSLETAPTLHRSWFFPSTSGTPTRRLQDQPYISYGTVAVLLLELLRLVQNVLDSSVCRTDGQRECHAHLIWTTDPLYQQGRRCATVQIMRDLLQFITSQEAQMSTNTASLCTMLKSSVHNVLRSVVGEESERVREMLTLMTPTSTLRIPAAPRVLLEYVHTMLKTVSPFVQEVPCGSTLSHVTESTVDVSTKSTENDFYIHKSPLIQCDVSLDNVELEPTLAACETLLRWVMEATLVEEEKAASSSHTEAESPPDDTTKDFALSSTSCEVLIEPHTCDSDDYAASFCQPYISATVSTLCRSVRDLRRSLNEVPHISSL